MKSCSNTQLEGSHGEFLVSVALQTYNFYILKLRRFEKFANSALAMPNDNIPVIQNQVFSFSSSHLFLEK